MVVPCCTAQKSKVVSHAAVKNNTESRQAQLYHVKHKRCTSTIVSIKSSITYFNAHSQETI